MPGKEILALVPGPSWRRRRTVQVEAGALRAVGVAYSQDILVGTQEGGLPEAFHGMATEPVQGSARLTPVLLWPCLAS